MTPKLSHLLPTLYDAATQYQSASEANKDQRLAQYVHILIECLSHGCVEDINQAPLIDIWAETTGEISNVATDRRSDLSTASPVLLARVCAVMDLLIAEDMSDETAAQILIHKWFYPVYVFPILAAISRP